MPTKTNHKSKGFLFRKRYLFPAAGLLLLVLLLILLALFLPVKKDDFSMEVKVSGSSVSTAESITLDCSLTNRSFRKIPVYYSEPIFLYSVGDYSEGTELVPIPDTLQPGESLTRKIVIPPGLPAGKHTITVLASVSTRILPENDVGKEFRYTEKIEIEVSESSLMIHP